MRIIFSRDRPAQLALLLDSLDRYAYPEATRILWWATKPKFVSGYACVTDQPRTPPERFDAELRSQLGTDDRWRTVSFFCDDDIVFRRLPQRPWELLHDDDSILSVCLYLGRQNVKQPIPPGFPRWEWGPLARHDFGFPCGIDGNTYRVNDVLDMIGSETIPNPTMLETVLALRLPLVAEKRPLMACFPDQCLVGVPVNRVSDQSGVPFGRKFPQTTEDLNRRFLAGERIDLDRLDFSGVDSCHHEIEFVWRSA